MKKNLDDLIFISILITNNGESGDATNRQRQLVLTICRGTVKVVDLRNDDKKKK